MLGLAVDLAEDRIERVLEHPVDGVALPRAQLVEVLVHTLLGLLAGGAMAAVEIRHHFLAREDALGDLVGH